MIYHHDIPTWHTCMTYPMTCVVHAWHIWYMHEIVSWHIPMTYLHDMPEIPMIYHHDISTWHTCMIYPHDISPWHTCMTYRNDRYSRFFILKLSPPGLNLNFATWFWIVLCVVLVQCNGASGHMNDIFLIQHHSTTTCQSTVAYFCFLLLLLLVLIFFLLLLLLHFCTFWSVNTCSPGAKFNMFSISFRVSVPNRVSWSYLRRCMSSIFVLTIQNL